jgi:predicted glutamine amidotransferase
MDRSYAARILSVIEARTLITHIRYGTVQPLDSTTNAHPFVAHIKGIDWAFAHNGYLSKVKSRAANKAYACHGTTDSEAFFAVLVDRLATGGSRAKTIAEGSQRVCQCRKTKFFAIGWQ